MTWSDLDFSTIILVWRVKSRCSGRASGQERTDPSPFREDLVGLDDLISLGGCLWQSLRLEPQMNEAHLGTKWSTQGNNSVIVCLSLWWVCLLHKMETEFSTGYTSCMCIRVVGGGGGTLSPLYKIGKHTKLNHLLLQNLSELIIAQSSWCPKLGI